MTPHFRLILRIVAAAFLSTSLAVLHGSRAEGCALFSTLMLVDGLLWLFSNDSIDSDSRGSIFGAIGISAFVVLVCGAVFMQFAPVAAGGGAWLVAAAAVVGLLVLALSVGALRAGQQLEDNWGRLAGRSSATRSGDAGLPERGR